MMHSRIARVAALGLVAALLGTAMLPEPAAAKRKPKDGVFGVINGRKFKATNLNGADDPCVNGIYNTSSVIGLLQRLRCQASRNQEGTAGDEPLSCKPSMSQPQSAAPRNRVV